MLLPQPVAVTEGVSYTTVDRRIAVATTKGANAAGIAQAVFPAVPEGYLWLVERMTVMCDSALPTQATVYAGDPIPINLIDGTSRGNLDVADETSPALVQTGLPLTAVWSGCTPGAIGTIRVQYQLVTRNG